MEQVIRSWTVCSEIRTCRGQRTKRTIEYVKLWRAASVWRLNSGFAATSVGYARSATFSTCDITADLPSIALTDYDPRIATFVVCGTTAGILKTTTPSSRGPDLIAARKYSIDRGKMIPDLPSRKHPSRIRLFDSLLTVK
jgi:hypothetical protein